MNEIQLLRSNIIKLKKIVEDKDDQLKKLRRELAKVKHHFIQNLSVNEDYSAGQFEIDAIKLIKEIHKKNDLVLINYEVKYELNSIFNSFINIPASLASDLPCSVKSISAQPVNLLSLFQRLCP